MNKIMTVLALVSSSILISACQTTPHKHNGLTGYQVIDRTDHTATLSYTLSGNVKHDQTKLQSACQQVLGTSKTYTTQVLNVQEIINPQQSTTEYGRQLGNTRTQFSLSNTPDLHNSENLGARDALNARPTTLRIIQFTCR